MLASVVTAVPRWSTPRQPDRPTYGPDVERMSRRTGRPLRRWQREVADAVGEVLPNGRMVYPLVVLIVPRRGGKTGLTLPQSLQRAMIAPRRRCWYTAQTGGDAATIFREEWVPLIKGSELAPFIRARMSNGSQRLMLPEDVGSYVGLFAPGPKALHGQDGDYITVDEAWAFSEAAGTELEEALRPTMLLRPQRQLVIISAGGTSDSTWLLRLRALGRRLVEEGRCEEAGMYYREYYPQGPLLDTGEIDGDAVDLDDPAVWSATHPILDEQPELLDVLRQDRETMGGPTFWRSYLSVFSSTTADRLISAEAYAATGPADGAPEPVPPGHVVIGYDVAHDRTKASVAVSGRTPEGRVYGEVIDHRPGTEWVADEVARVRSRLRTDVYAESVGPVVTVTAQLRAKGVEVKTLNGTEYPAACAAMLDDITTGRFQRRRQPPLDVAVATVQRREVGDGFVWSRKRSGADISPLVAITVAAAGGRLAASPRPFIGLRG